MTPTAQPEDSQMTPITPKPNVSREQRLKLLGETLKGMTPKQVENAVRVAGNLLARKINKMPRPG